MIRYTQPSALNDPFEGKVQATGIASREYVLETVTDDFMDEQFEQVLAQYPRSVRALLTEDVLGTLKRTSLSVLPRIFDDVSPRIASAITSSLSAQVRQRLGVLSLSATPTHALMWSHYTQNGRGFVLGFNTRHAHFDARRADTDEFRHLRAVEYRDHLKASYLVDFTGLDLLYVKSTDWQYEQEWRIVRAVTDGDETVGSQKEPIYLFTLPPLAVSHVIMGYGMSDSDTKRLSYVLGDPKYTHVTVSQAKLSTNDYGVDVSI